MGGGSRAAKKRAKAKAKAQKQLDEALKPEPAMKMAMTRTEDPEMMTMTMTMMEVDDDNQTKKKKRKTDTSSLSQEKKRKRDKESKKKNDTMDNDNESNDKDDDDSENNNNMNDSNDDGGASDERKQVKFTSDTNFEPKPEPSMLNDFLYNINMDTKPPTSFEILYQSVDEKEEYQKVAKKGKKDEEENKDKNDNDDDDNDNDNDDDKDETPSIQNLTTEDKAKLLLATLIHPTVKLDEFYSEYWEKKPLLVQASEKTSKEYQHKHSDRLNGFLTKSQIQHLLQTQALRYGKDINVTNYTKTQSKSKEKRRVTLDLLPEKTPTQEEDYILVDPKDVWANFGSTEPSSACTIRLLCPQKFIDPIHSLLSMLETELGCMVGANVYLTPPNGAQGFAPHYDDIEAFILQLEGEKHWKVYPPLPPGNSNALPRTSSRDFTMAEMKDHTPVIDVILKPGDVLYMPRGWIHQACTIQSNNPKEKKHSLHLTISAMQQWSWIDLMEILIPDALQTCAKESLSLRQGLPRNFVNYMGLMHQQEDGSNAVEEKTLSKEEAFYEEDDEKEKRLLRKSFQEEAKKRIMRVCKEAISMIDDGCDQISKRFLSDRQPPALTEQELDLTSDGPTKPGLIKKILPNTLCRLVRPNIAKVMIEEVADPEGGEDDEPSRKAVLYHCNENTREFHGNPLRPMEFELDDAPALEILLTTIEPQWVCVNDLLHNGDIEDKIGIAEALYDEGILAIWNPTEGLA